MSKIYLQSLGCSKNLVDSENMLGILKMKGHTIVEFADKADYIIINTCSFINDAKEESINSIIEAAQLKQNTNIKIIVTGCLAQRYSYDLFKEVPEIDILVGTHGYDKIDLLIEKFEAEKDKVINIEMDETIVEDLPRELLTPNYYAFLKISEGCSNNCTYCIIPKIRGKYRSRKIEDIVKEAHILADQGIKELIIIAQDTSKYGVDIYGERQLHKLIQKLSKIDGIEWIRIHYLYPEDFYDELIQEFRNNNKLLKYFDIPLQHISNDVLKRMSRKTSNEQITHLIEKIRTEVPEAVIRTSLITGFPGETQEDHNMLKSFLQQYKLDRVGVFKYSREEDTPAYRLKDQIDEEVKEQRQEELMQIQQAISFANNNAKIGNVYDVIIDEDSGENEYVGRTYMDSPEIDGCVFVNSKKKLEVGNIYKVNIVDALEYDLIGDIEDEDELTQ
ncbi:30S ribosomal protein S12 methylthiotransferase RimO [Sedimentibacter sp. zth1]|uniref:30S ribosomal protein S12 methylthiotransferase RimO n=1 Tax=Sedimentibacter sp. zth1 TaxID=2816908 RepID=UPI001A90FEFA|nr:30S ribosomal protein S12 methylthiotransferase RimO [Sedimentibacter sp. zth1]QSX06519.1 30S ribosomal protein S12 methylthiotransferase RimO [Sedimentibacter sp. zth1]